MEYPKTGYLSATRTYNKTGKLVIEMLGMDGSSHYCGTPIGRAHSQRIQHMPSQPIQEQFGQTIIDSIAEFAIRDIDNVATMKKSLFSHISDPALQTTLAETLYGARWIYKLGLALLVRDEEQLAHVRVQLIDYGAVCEGLLVDLIAHGIAKGHLAGARYKFKDVKKLKCPINWSVKDIQKQVARQIFYWQIAVAEEENMISISTAKRLDSLRLDRNTVHMAARTSRAYIGRSHTAFETLNIAITEAKAWKAANP